MHNYEMSVSTAGLEKRVRELERLTVKLQMLFERQAETNEKQTELNSTLISLIKDIEK